MTEFTEDGDVSLVLKPVLGVQFLPRCPACFDRHPLAYQPPSRSETCLSCGARLPDLPPEQDAASVIVDPTIRLGAVLLRIGRWLNSVRKDLL